MATRVLGARRGADRSLASSAARGAGLIGAAVIVGIILLQVVDDGGPSGGGGGNGNGAPVTSETVPATSEDQRPPSEVAVVVLNAGQPTGSAQTKANQLRTAGYNTLPASNDPVGRQGVAVQCRAGFDSEATALALVVGEEATTEPFPAQPPVEAENADCIVILGSA